MCLIQMVATAICLYCSRSEGNQSWTWIDGSPLDFQSWKDDGGENGERCASITGEAYDDADNLWASHDCETRLSFVCQVDESAHFQDVLDLATWRPWVQTTGVAGRSDWVPTTSSSWVPTTSSSWRPTTSSSWGWEQTTLDPSSPTSGSWGATTGPPNLPTKKSWRSASRNPWIKTRDPWAPPTSYTWTTATSDLRQSFKNRRTTTGDDPATWYTWTLGPNDPWLTTTRGPWEPTESPTERAFPGHAAGFPSRLTMRSWRRGYNWEVTTAAYPGRQMMDGVFTTERPDHACRDGVPLPAGPWVLPTISPQRASGDDDALYWARTTDADSDYGSSGYRH